jgi:hypothetical protein
MDYYSEEQLAVKELRSVAHHEAGHKVLWQQFGGAGHAFVWRRLDRGPDEKAWCGQFRPISCPEAMQRAFLTAGILGPQLPPNWRVLVGMAGILSEELLIDQTSDTEVIAESLFSRIWMGEASATDLNLMGIADIDDFKHDYEVAEEAIRLLRESWSNVQSVAECLISEAEEILLRSI